MATSSPVDTQSPYIGLARNYMGNVDLPDTLAGAFMAATPMATTPPPANGNTYPNFWQVGCVFDTILDYFLVLQTEQELTAEDRALMETLVSQAVIGYQYGIVGGNANWYDDWCWWGIAASKAFDPEYEAIFGAQADFFRNAAMDLWGLVDFGDYETMADNIPQQVWDASGFVAGTTPPVRFTKDMLTSRALIHKGTRNSWARILAGATGHGDDRSNADCAAFTSPATWAVPRFFGGCWQYDFSSQPFPVGDGQSWFWPDPSPSQQDLGVFQLTLMQGLYLSFCCSLRDAAVIKAAAGKTGGGWDRLQPPAAYQGPAEEVVGFLTNWLLGVPTASLAEVFTEGVLLHERVPTYAQLPTGGDSKVNGYVPTAYWAGDQGLIMGALKQYDPIPLPADPEHPSAFDYPPMIVRGMFYNMCMVSPPDTIAPYLPLDTPPDNDAGDYGSGSGIFWRYVLRCCRLDPGFSAQISDDPLMLQITKTSAATPDDCPDLLFHCFNSVAAALGAWVVTKNVTT